LQILIEMVKSLFVDLETDSMMVPWIYICFNKDLNAALADRQAESGKKIPMSANSSKLVGLGGTSTNINKSANVLGLG
jgi:hypothetical protein